MGCRDTTIKIFDPKKPLKPTAVLRGHTDWINNLKVFEDFVVSASCDKKIKVWSLEKKECVATLEGHSGAVHNLLLDPQNDSKKPRLLSCSSDMSINIWDLDSSRLSSSLFDHSDEVLFIDHFFFSNYLASASKDGFLKLWNIHSQKTPFFTIRAHTKQITSLTTISNKILTTGMDSKINLFEFPLSYRN